MTLSELYASLKSTLKNGTLTISHDTANGAYSQLLYSVYQKEVLISSCSVTLNAENVIITGQTEMLPYTSIGLGTVTITSGIDYTLLPSNVIYNVKLSVNGSGELNKFCATLPPSYDNTNKANESLFSKFIIYNPILEYDYKELKYSLDWTISGFASCPVSDERWDEYRIFLSEKMPFTGDINIISNIYSTCNLDFKTQNLISFPFGNAVANLAMRVIKGSSIMHDGYITMAYLLYDIKLKSTSQVARFQSQLFVGDEYQSTATFFSPPLSLGSIADFMQSVFNIEQDHLLLPENTMLSSFGLQELQMTLSKKGNTLFDGMSIERIYSIFSLANPIETFIPNLTLDEFQMVWEISWWGDPESVLSLFACAKATLKIGSYNLVGELTGYFPIMNFEGSLKLEKQMSLTQLADGYNIPIPKDWNGGIKEIASLSIYASVRSRAFGITASVSDLITITIGDLNLKLAKLTVNVDVAPSKLDFGIQGIIDFAPSGYDPFSFTLSAKYQNKDWLFLGKLSSGKVNIGGLLMSLFSINASQCAVNIELDGFEISYSVNEKQFKLYASFTSSWFTVFGVTPKLGGKIMLDSTEKKLEASAALFIDIGDFRFLVQANDFYSDEKRSFLFRVEFMKKYIQAVYQKTNNDEIVTITLGGLTFGDILLALIHLINPNAKQTLSSPWDILHKIQLSNFSLVINVTKKSAALLYHVNLNIAGLMQIDDIGLSYSSKDGIDYILTGKLLDKTYTSDKPLSWDAVNGAPPVNSATDEKKVKLYYLGIGNHLDLKISQKTIPNILKEVTEQLTPTSDVPSVRYTANSGWIFGIDFEISDMFRIKMLFYSPVLYGAIIEVQASEKSPLALFNGMILELFYKKISDSTGMLHCRLIVPEKYADINLGAISIHLGQFLLEIYTNGSFFIDLGFPHDNDFSNSFGLSMGIFGGKGGLYFGVLFGDAVNSVPVVTNGAFTPVIRIGIGLSIGISRSFDFGVVKGGVSLTMVGIFEGTFAIFHPTDKNLPEAFYYKVRAVVGISGSIFLSIDFKIIAISASASISALCELTMESYKKTLIELTLDIKLSAYIKILFFKIQFSFHFNYKASFTIGSDSTPPWRLANSSLKSRSALYSNSIMIDSSKSVGSWRISPTISPLCSILNPNEDTKKYCMAFPLIINNTEIHSIIDMLTQWVLSHIAGDDVSFQDAEEIKTADFGNSLEYQALLEFLSLNITISPKLEVQNKSNEVNDGVIFPILPQLTLKINDTKINFGENYISEADMQKISEYFYQLNADPVYNFSKSLRATTMIPFCGAILTDWFKMALSEITGRIEILFSSITVSTSSLDTTVSQYGTDMECVLSDNPEISLKIHKLPTHSITISNGDTLKKLQDQYKLSKTALWNTICHSSLILNSTTTVTYDNKYKFDNRKSKFTVLQASAMFFVRLFNPDVIYTPYAELILNNNSVDMTWECKYISERVLTLSNRTYIALAGDTVVRIAKMLCLFNNECTHPDWIAFRDNFIANNGESASAVIDSYTISNATDTYNVSGYSDCLSLFCTCYPDFTEISDNHLLWSSEILRPLASIALTDVAVSDEGKLSDLLQKYDIKDIALAVTQHTADLENLQDLVISLPNIIAKSELVKRILTDDSVSQIGSILSRGFMQGARPPAPATQIETPLYKLLNQQIELNSIDIPHILSIKCNEAISWIIPSADEVTITKDDLAKLLPTGELGTIAMPKEINPLHCQEICWSIANGHKILNSKPLEVITFLPKDCIRYLNRYETLPRLECNNSATTEFSWCSIIPIRVIKKNDGVYYLYGASADNRALLYNLSSASIKQCRMMYSPTKLESENSGLASMNFKECKIIKTNLSKETHYGLRSMNNEVNPYIASITESNRFLTLLWQCSAIGGGFWLYHDGDALPYTIFDDDGTVTINIVVTLDSKAPQHNAINGIILPNSNDGYALLGDDEHIYSPVLPAGCVGLKCTRNYDENDHIQSLYQLLGYSVHSKALNQNVESASILPVAISTDKLEYTVAVPLWKLTDSIQQSSLHTYSAVKKEHKLQFNLRDVLGNTVEIGDVNVTGEYNDNMIALHELPDTKLNYIFTSDDISVFIKVTCSYSSEKVPVYSNTENLDETAIAHINTAKTAMYQLSCTDIEITGNTTLNENVHKMEVQALNQIREYVSKLYRNLKDAVHNSISPVEFVIPIEISKIPSEITQLGVYITVRRTLAKSVSEQVCFAKSIILADENSNDFYESFNNAFPKQRIAFNQSDELYFVPLNSLASTLSVKPYTYQLNGKAIKSPEFVSLAPLSNVLMTRNVDIIQQDGTIITQAFVDIDVNNWEKRILSDIENLLASKIVCKASNECPNAVMKLVSAKENLSKALSNRLIPIRKNSAEIPIDTVSAFAEDRFNKNLNLAYSTDVIAVYQSSLGPSNSISLEPHINTPHILSATKLSSKNDIFCLFLSDSNQCKSEKLSLDINFSNVEYNIKSTQSGYDYSEWLRLQKPILSDDQIDLTADTKIPYPRKECPMPPSMSYQTFETKEQEFLYWNWSTVVACSAYEQYTICFYISFDNNPSLKLANKRDVFDILAEYDYKREWLMNSTQTDKDFAKAYKTVSDLAFEFSEATLNPLKSNPIYKHSQALIPVKITFDIDECGINYTILPDAERNRLIKSLGAKLEPIEHIEGKKEGDLLSFKLIVSHLPIYECRHVTPTAWIVQNDNLFDDPYQSIAEDFIFKTEKVSLPCMRVHVDYNTPIVIKEKSIESAIASIWNYLKADELIRINISVHYQYPIQNTGSDFMLTAPVTFNPNAEKNELIDNIADWLSENLPSQQESHESYIPDKSKFLFDVTVYESESDLMLIHAGFIVEIGN